MLSSTARESSARLHVPMVYQRNSSYHPPLSWHIPTKIPDGISATAWSFPTEEDHSIIRRLLQSLPGRSYQSTVTCGLSCARRIPGAPWRCCLNSTHSSWRGSREGRIQLVTTSTVTLKKAFVFCMKSKWWLASIWPHKGFVIIMIIIFMITYVDGNVTRASRRIWSSMGVCSMASATSSVSGALI